MNGKIIFALVLVAIAASVESTKPTPTRKFAAVKKSPQPSSADVEALLNPTVQSLPKGQHKLVFKGASGQEQCVVCQPFQGCGCRDVVAIRCELKRLKQKLLRLKRIAHPHKHSHHGRHVENKPKPTDKAVKPTVKVVVKPKNTGIVAPKPAVKVAVKPAAKPAVQKPKVKKVVVKKPALVKKPLVKVAVKPAVVKPAVQPAVQPAPLIKIAAPVAQPAPKPAVAVLPIVATKPDEKKNTGIVAPQVKLAVLA